MGFCFSASGDHPGWASCTQQAKAWLHKKETAAILGGCSTQASIDVLKGLTLGA
jgi:hypothetical protein